MQNKTHMWNLVFSNHTVELINNATVVNPSYTRDGKPSVVLDYGKSEAIIFRQFRDEMREVSVARPRHPRHRYVNNIFNV